MEAEHRSQSVPVPNGQHTAQSSEPRVCTRVCVCVCVCCAVLCCAVLGAPRGGGAHVVSPADGLLG